MRTKRRQSTLNLQEFRYGVELECVGRDRETVARAIASVVGGEVTYVGGSYDAWNVRDSRNRVWGVVTDSSLRSVPAHLRAELVSPILEYGDIEEFQSIIRAVRGVGAHVDGGCGLHMHVGTEKFDGKALVNLAKTFYKYEPLILAALGVNEQRLSQYTKPLSDSIIKRLEKLKNKSKDAVNKAWYGYQNNSPSRYCNSRYQTLNMNSVWYRGTVEFRMANSSLHAGKVKAVIQFCLALCAHAVNSRCASSRKREFDPASAKYDLRVLLLRLGMNGKEFRTARRHLLAAMPGDAAWKHGRPQPKKAENKEPEVCHEQQ